ncbi:MAG: serine hydrolase [Caulobacteraceae bacterium]
MRADFIRASLIPILAATFLVSGCATGAQAPPVHATVREDGARDLLSRVDEYMNAAVRHAQFSGSILIARDGVPLVSRGYGMANYELGVANTPQTVFRIASLTKQFTALAIMQLQERGRLNVSDPICNYLDNCPQTWRPITIRQLLTHTSGIPNFSSQPNWDEIISVQRHTRLGFINVFRDLPPLFAPGEGFRYSNSGYYLLGLIIERASGESYNDYLRENIFAPLGMSNSGLHDGRTLVANRAAGYDWSGSTFIIPEYANEMNGFANGGLYSTTHDLLRWDQSLYTDQLVSRQSLDEIFTPIRERYGYGWLIVDWFGRQTYGHSGSFQGFSSFIARVPGERLTIIVLSNSDRASATAVARSLAAIALGEDYALPEQQLFDRLWETIIAEGAAAAAEQIRQVRREQPDAAEEHEELLNDLGYDLMANRRIEDAILMFALAVELFPQSANTYDSLAEGYMNAGQRDLAIRTYQSSLELDPENEHAARMIGELRTTN